MLSTEVQRGVRLNKKKKSTNISPYPDEAIERLAWAFYPAILACWNSEEGQREFAVWQAEQAHHGKKEKQEVSLNFTHNAKLVIIDDYYFIEPPVLEIALDGCEEIEFDYLVYRRNDGVIDQMVTFIQNEKALKDERQMLTEKNAAHEARIAKLGKELNDLQATVEYQAEKIRQLENLKVYKMYQKVRKIVKRGN